jgi:uncharacterized membrane protein
MHSEAGAAAGTVPGAQKAAPPGDAAPDVALAARRGGEGALTRSQLTVIVVIIVGYAGLSYYSDSAPNAPNLAAALSVGPVVLIGLALVWRWTRPWAAVLIGAVTAAVLYRYWAFIRGHYPWSNLVQQTGAYGFVALGFARSLGPGLVPLCTQMADKLHGPLTAAEVGYTRRATVAWAIFYALLTLTIAGLFFAASARVWSLFVNFATFGLIGLMFVAEHTVRLKVLPQRRRGGTLVALRQFFIGRDC